MKNRPIIIITQQGPKSLKLTTILYSESKHNMILALRIHRKWRYRSFCCRLGISCGSFMCHSGWRNSSRMQQLPGSYILLAPGTPARCISNHQLITILILCSLIRMSCSSLELDLFRIDSGYHSVCALRDLYALVHVLG